MTGPRGGRNTMRLRKPRIRGPNEQEPAEGLNAQPSYIDRYHYAHPADMMFHSIGDMNFERPYSQNERFGSGDRRNNNFQNFPNNSGPSSLNFPHNYQNQNRMMNRPHNYPHNDWVPAPRTQPGQLNINQPSTSRVTNSQLDNVSQQIQKASQNKQFQNKKKNSAQAGAHASSASSSVESVSQGTQDLKGITEQFRMYICPSCKENYTYKHHQTRLVGKLPLILHCSHTVCQECVYKNLTGGKIVCPVCQHENVLTPNQIPINMADLQKPFQPNFYILGMMFFSRPPGGFLGNLGNIKLVSNTQKKSNSLPVTEKCCFGSCLKEATMYCPSCDSIFCNDCCIVIHKSAKALMCHEPVPRKQKKFSFRLEACPDHPEMLLEFYCKECHANSCCYCVLDHHGTHDRVPLYQLTDTEKEEFQNEKENAFVALREVLATQKKASTLSNFSANPIKFEIAAHFADRHAKLYTIEKRLLDEVSDVKTTHKGLELIQATLQQTAEVLKQLIKFDPRNVGDQKLNLKGALQKLKEIGHEPRFLLNNDGVAEPVRFVNKFTAADESDSYQVIKSEDSEYKLVAKDDLPEDYVFEDLPPLEDELELMTKSETMTMSNMSMLDENKIRYQPSDVSGKTDASRHSQGRKKTGMEKVEVQHINSMDSFFIQYKNMQSKLNALNKDIENYVKMGAAENVLDVELHSCYLVLYIIERHGETKEQKWCRGKVVDSKNDESTGDMLYEVFLIDYGKTQVVKGNRIREIPAFLLKHKPFAVECQLYNPMNVDWNQKAHFNLAKILNGKQVFMVVKSTQPSDVLVVDLMVSSSDGSVTSVIDILVYTTNTASNEDVASITDDRTETRKEGYYPQLKVFPNSKRFTKHQTEKVILANVIDPHNVFVHMEAHQDAFKNMAHLIKKAYRHSKNTGIVPIEGTYVLLEYRDSVRSNWHRAFIKSVDMKTDQVHAVLVDWGLTVLAPTTNIRPMQESFTKLEAQAVLVKLAHIAPFNKQANWSAHAATFLQTYLASKEVLKMVVHDTADNEVSVALFDLNGNVPVCINGLLVEQNLADSTGPVSTRCEWPQYETDTPRFSEEDGVLDSMLKKVDEEDSDSGEEDCRQISRLQVEVLKVVSPDELYVKFLKLQDKEAKLFKELNVIYMEEKERVTKEKWVKDELCVVELDSQKAYCRGKIIAEIPGGYRVNLCDRAEEIETVLEKIFVFNKYFSSYPNVAMRSHLANIRPAGDTGKWSISSIETLQRIVQRKKRLYACKADESAPDPTKKSSMPLDMWYGIVIPGGALEPDHMKYVCINQSLIRMGFAYKKPTLNSFEKAIISSSSSATDELNHHFDDIASKNEKLKKMLNQTDDNKTTGKIESGLKTFKMGIKEMLSASKEAKPKKEKSTKTVISSSEGESSACSVKTVASKEKRSKKSKHEKKEVENLKKNETDTGSETEKEIVKSPVSWNALIEEECLALDQPSTSKATTQERKEETVETVTSDQDEEDSDDSAKEDSPYHRKEVDISDWLPPFRLTKREFRARVTCVETGGGVYLHDESIHDAYEKIEENIKAYFDTNPPKTEDDSYWQPGRLCTIKYEDGKWYRGRVLKIKDPNLINVFMIDFGSDHDVSADCLYREVLYTDIEAFATKVKLDKVFSKDGGPWLSSDYDAFIDIVTQWCHIKVMGPIDVELPLVQVITEGGVNVNEELVKISNNLVKRRIGADAYAEDTDEDELLVIEETPELYLSDEGSGPSNPRLESRSSEKIAGERHNESADGKDITVISCYTMLDWKYTIKNMPTPLFKGEKVLLEIGGILSYDRVALKECGQNSSPDFYDLIIDIQDCADTLPQLTDLRVGVPCIAPFSEDEVWYRAKISSVDDLPVGKVEVLFVDYGNSESVKLKDVRALRPDWLEYPQQTWEANLGFRLKDESDKDEVYQMISLLQSKRKFVKLLTRKPIVSVELYEQEDKLCYQNLIDLGLIEVSP